MDYSKSDKAVNVIFISFDTLRQDFLSCYGYPKPLSPNLDELANNEIPKKSYRLKTALGFAS